MQNTSTNINICIIGSGTYGSYIANILSSKNFHVTIIDVGDSDIKNENEMGFTSKSKKIISNKYLALQKGRFFGFGGSSAKWGGQLLFFDDSDFKKPTHFLSDLISVNKKYKSKVLNRFGIYKYINHSNEVINEHFTTKNGIWLSYFKRNLFKLFKIKKVKNVTIISNARVTKLDLTEKKIKCLYYEKNHEKKSLQADYYFLTTGAFETARILIDSGVVSTKSINFSDHFSTKLFEISGSSKIGNIDFTFNFNNDYSLSTNRLIGEIDGISYFIHPIFNQNFLFFQNLKSVLFKGNFSFKSLYTIFSDFPYIILFIYNIFINKKLYVHKNKWFLQIDIESHTDISTMLLSDLTDNYKIRTFCLDSINNENLYTSIFKVKDILKEFLLTNNVIFKEVNPNPTSLKIEDTYHPYNIFPVETSLNDYYKKYDNMLVVNTGILPRVGGINPTATLFPLIEDFLNNYLIEKIND